jgi:hypothetical protein
LYFVHRDKKVVGVFVRFSCAASGMQSLTRPVSVEEDVNMSPRNFTVTLRDELTRLAISRLCRRVHLSYVAVQVHRVYAVNALKSRTRR